jgi:hypothetical protein
MDAATLPVRRIVRANDGHATGRHRHARPQVRVENTLDGRADRHATGTP